MEGLYTGEIPKLKDLSTNVIIKYFDRLMLALESKQVPPMPYEYLQRVQSQVLLKTFLRKKEYSRYIKFLLNPFIKDISLNQCAWNSHDVMEQLMTIANTIENLSLYGWYFTMHHLSALACKMSNLKSLCLSSINVTKQALENIGKYCTSLSVLRMPFSTTITDALITALCCTDNSGNGTFQKNRTLQHLDIRRTCVTAAGIAFILEHFPNLESIQHHNVFTALCNIYTEYHGKRASRDLKIYKLKKLTISSRDQYFNADSLKMCTALCPYVNEISVGYVSFQSQLDAIAQFSELSKVCIFCPKDSSLDISSIIINRGNNFKMLVLKNISISLQVLLICPKLKSLKLKNVKFLEVEALGDPNQRHILQHLTVLTIECVDFSDDGVFKSANCILSSAPNLEKLTFRYVDFFTVDVVNSIATHTCVGTIREVSIVDSYVEGSVVKKLLLLLPVIKRIDLKHTPIKSQDFKAMRILRPSVKIVIDYNTFLRINEEEDESDVNDEIIDIDDDTWTEEGSDSMEDGDDNSSIDVNEEFQLDVEEEFQLDVEEEFQVGGEEEFHLYIDEEFQPDMDDGW